jgi:hypothetical protein
VEPEHERGKSVSRLERAVRSPLPDDLVGQRLALKNSE